MRLRLVLAAATLLGGCATRPPAPVATRAAAPKTQPVYYRPAAKAAPAPAQQTSAQQTSAQPTVAQPAACIPPAAPISAAQQEELFQRFDQTRGQGAAGDAAAR